MKSIPLRDEAPFKSIEVITLVVKQPVQGQGINADDMRRRVRLLDALEKADGDSLLLEDADHAVLVRLINGFQFGTADRRLLQIIDDIADAKAPQEAEAA